MEYPGPEYLDEEDGHMKPMRTRRDHGTACDFCKLRKLKCKDTPGGCEYVYTHASLARR
ncbi:hypothetical protein CERSUDRAFT_115200 [Gelatoporia subvermispora B]|uniref:Zn(2)-C6 fungal-type domain-containing protein n=1 Tax=Ceriporiopsis subvermispora (strain B) TaxID=914234 RepID=M2PJ56_CERS8|nr:hypothetical protein CERSUDRAFT_115200 [Gelatoporia subvermispora B]